MVLNPKRLHKKDFDYVLDALARFYDRRPEEYGLMERSQAVYEDYAKFINNILPNKAAHILDFGTGSWRIPETIGKYGYEKVVGLDYFSSEKLNEYSNHLTNANTILATYNGKDIPFPDSSFDVVSSLCVIEHLIYIKETLDEFDRVLKPEGIIIIQCPNWSCPLVTFSAIKHSLANKGRFWLYNNFLDGFMGFFRSIGWYFEVLLSTEPKFIMVFPRMKNGEIDFERSDDDVVHLCQPLSLKKYFKNKKYRLLIYNRGAGWTTASRIFNKLFPSLATTNIIVAQKGDFYK